MGAMCGKEFSDLLEAAELADASERTPIVNPVQQRMYNLEKAKLERDRWISSREKYEKDKQARRPIQEKIITLLKSHPEGRLSTLNYKVLIERAAFADGYIGIEGYIQMVGSARRSLRKQLVAQPSMSLEDHTILVRIDEDLMEIAMLNTLLDEWKSLEQELKK